MSWYSTPKHKQKLRSAVKNTLGATETELYFAMLGETGSSRSETCEQPLEKDARRQWRLILPEYLKQESSCGSFGSRAGAYN